MLMLQKISLFFILVILGNCYFLPLPAQQKERNYNYYNGDYEEMLVEAESYYMYEEYKEALHLYRLLQDQFPQHYGIKYRIGQCLTELPYNKEKSIDFFQKAAEHVDTNNTCQEISLKQPCVPVDIFYYLGNAYRINNQLNKAIKQYKTFIEIGDPSTFDMSLAKEQIQACNNAKQLMKHPLKIKWSILGENINNNFANTRPVISGNDSVMVYTSKLKFYDAIFCSRKNNGQWSKPQNIIPQLKVDDNTYPTSLSYKGNILYLYRNEDYGGDIFVSHFRNGRWSEVKQLDEPVNTKYWEAHACITKDTSTLYFTSNRKGGHGGLDIYKVTRNEKGEWTNPVNLGDTINTPYNDRAPFITSDGTTLFFSSYGHYNIGGYDIFKAQKKSRHWSTPVNMGYPMNTTDDDLFYMPINKGKKGYYSTYKPDEGYGKEDIYFLEIQGSKK